MVLEGRNPADQYRRGYVWNRNVKIAQTEIPGLKQSRERMPDHDQAVIGNLPEQTIDLFPVFAIPSQPTGGIVYVSHPSEKTV